MEQPPIKSFSFDYVVKNIPMDLNVALRSNCMVAKINTTHRDMRHSAYRVNAYGFWFCLQGEAELIYNMEEHRIGPGGLIVIPPNSIVELREIEPISEGYVMLVDPLFMNETDLNLKKIINVMLDQNIRQGMVLLNEADRDRMRMAFELAWVTVANEAQTPFRDDVVQAMIKLLLYKVCEIVATQNQISEVANTATSRSEEYFRRFIKELSEHYLERRTVTYYADQLCISSRYLTTIVRRVSGHSVTDWMNRYVMMEARYLLKYSEMSIQEIAYKLSFPNQSFFGKYFKQHAGVSPSTYRQQQ